MTPGEIVPALPVLTEENLWPEFAVAVETLGQVWRAPSGRAYRLEHSGRTLCVSLLAVADVPAPPLPSAAIDRDLFELACAIQDAVGGDWSGAALRKSAAIFGWPGETRR